MMMMTVMETAKRLIKPGATYKHTLAQRATRWKYARIFAWMCTAGFYTARRKYRIWSTQLGGVCSTDVFLQYRYFIIYPFISSIHILLISRNALLENN